MVNTKFWDDNYIITIEPTMKYMFLYLLTNPLTNIAGAYEITIKRIAFDTGLTEEKVVKILEKFTKDERIIFKDGWILLCNFIKNQSLNSKIQKGIEEAVKCCPDWIKDRLSMSYDRLSHLNPNLNPNLNTKRKPKPVSFDTRFLEVFEEWKQTLNKRASPDLKRQALVLARLDEGLTVDELKMVSHGALKSKWHLGENPSRKKYLEMKTLFKDREQVEKFIELAMEPIQNGNGKFFH